MSEHPKYMEPHGDGTRIDLDAAEAILDDWAVQSGHWKNIGLAAIEELRAARARVEDLEAVIGELRQATRFFCVACDRDVARVLRALDEEEGTDE